MIHYKALEYACKSWHKHLVDLKPVQMLKITPILHRFLEEKFLFWLEILSILGVMREAVHALEVVVKHLDVCHILLPNVFKQFTQAGSRHHQCSTLPETILVS